MNYGYTKLASGWSGIQLENLIHLAVGELYLNRLRESASGQIRRQQNVSGLYSSFAQLMDQNLFLFYFQPIIDVRTSTICAYEALMRTASPVKLSPLEILTIAREAGRLYEVDKKEISLLDLALQRYTALMLRQGSYTLNGEASHNIDFAIYCADGVKARLTVNNINIKGIEEPTIRLGDRSRLELILNGKNTLDKEGILVPASASLTVRGCRRSAGEGISVIGSKLNLVGNGVSVVCFGSYDGVANISVRDSQVNVHGDGNEVLLVGTNTGSGRVNIENSLIDLSAACEILAAFGTMNGSLDGVFSGCEVVSDTHCDKGAVFGSVGGEAEICFRDSKVRLYGEGYRVSGFGSMNGKCVTKVESGEIDASLLAVEILLLGNEHSPFVVTGGNIHLAQDSDHTPVSPAGTPLCFADPSKDHYEATFRDGDEEWTYKADRNENGYLGVWILL